MASVQVAALWGMFLALPSWACIRVSILTPPRYGTVEISLQHPLRAGNWSAWAPLQGFCPFPSGFVPSFPPVRHPGPGHSSRGAPAMRPTSHRFLLPPKICSRPHGASPGALGSRGWGHFPGTPLPPSAGGSEPSEALSPSSLAHPAWVPAPGTSVAAGGGGSGGCQAGRVAMPWWDGVPRLRRLRSGGEGSPVMGRVAEWVGCRWQPPCWLWDPPHRPRGSSRAPTRCLCGKWRCSCNPALGGWPHLPPSQKHPSTLQRAPHSGRGLNPRCATL